MVMSVTANWIEAMKHIVKYGRKNNLNNTDLNTLSQGLEYFSTVLDEAGTLYRDFTHLEADFIDVKTKYEAALTMLRDYREQPGVTTTFYAGFMAGLKSKSTADCAQALEDFLDGFDIWEDGHEGPEDFYTFELPLVENDEPVKLRYFMRDGQYYEEATYENEGYLAVVTTAVDDCRGTCEICGEDPNVLNEEDWEAMVELLEEWGCAPFEDYDEEEDYSTGYVDPVHVFLNVMAEGYANRIDEEMTQEPESEVEEKSPIDSHGKYFDLDSLKAERELHENHFKIGREEDMAPELAVTDEIREDAKKAMEATRHVFGPWDNEPTTGPVVNGLMYISPTEYHKMRNQLELQARRIEQLTRDAEK